AVIFALAGVIGALTQLVIMRRVAVLLPLITALLLAFVANILLAVTAKSRLDTVAEMMFIGAYTGIGLFGLDPTAPKLFAPTPATTPPDSLSLGRLVFLGVAVAGTPVVIGARVAIDTNREGLVLLVSSGAIAALVMVRIGQLSAQRAHLERALRHEATHDE